WRGRGRARHAAGAMTKRARSVQRPGRCRRHLGLGPPVEVNLGPLLPARTATATPLLPEPPPSGLSVAACWRWAGPSTAGRARALGPPPSGAAVGPPGHQGASPAASAAGGGASVSVTA